ncbi:MAG: hypothetical protein ABSF37_06675 [Sedimentisphaerales bacterium]
MDILTFLTHLVDSLVWPIVAIILVILLRSPISKLLLLIVKIRYNDLEIWFSKEMASIKSEVPNQELPNLTKEEEQNAKKLIQESPVHAVLTAWNSLEKAIYEKLKELFPQNSLQYQKLAPERAFTDLMLTGALSPATEETINKLSVLRNQLSHSIEHTISVKDALVYISLTKRIQKKIEALTELPTVKLTPLTITILELNHLIDSGRYNNITLGDIKHEIDKGTIIQYIQEKANDDVDFSIILNGKTYPGFEKFYIDYLQRICNAYSGNERRKWGVERLGLCLLLAWTNEIIQQGGGWYPSK